MVNSSLFYFLLAATSAFGGTLAGYSPWNPTPEHPHPVSAPLKPRTPPTPPTNPLPKSLPLLLRSPTSFHLRTQPAPHYAPSSLLNPTPTPGPLHPTPSPQPHSTPGSSPHHPPYPAPYLHSTPGNSPHPELTLHTQFCISSLLVAYVNKIWLSLVQEEEFSFF